MSSNKYKFDKLVDRYCDEIVDFGEVAVDFCRTMRWIVLVWGFIIETAYVDDDWTTVFETLVSYNGKTATLVHRYREGPNHNKMKRYLRDEQYPIPCCVKLLS
jgi:hypothetical protein